jgi:ectoine utilization protein EutC
VDDAGPIVLSEAEVRETTALAETIEAVEDAFKALARGEARLPGVLYLDLTESNGDVHLKGAHIKGDPFYVFKVASGFYDNPTKGLPVGAGVSMAFDATTGRLAAILLDNGYLTYVRTGAAGAVAANYLAKKQLSKVAVIGAGLAAAFQLRALAVVRKFPEVHVCSLSRDTGKMLAADLSDEIGARFVVQNEPSDAVEGADLVITATPSRTPILRSEWLSPGVHITAMGADAPEKQELFPDVFRVADLIVVDDRAHCLTDGELHHAVEAGAIGADDPRVLELGQVLLGKEQGRVSDEQVTIVDLTGLGVQDVAVAKVTLDRARALGLGSKLPA